jgi:RNA polymerase sigma factor for flagellar operon FliA
MTDAERKEWRDYQRTGEVSARNRLVERHLPLVHHFARRLESRIGSALELEDLVSAGTVGLLGAVRTYDPGLGYRFSTFAARRIRGAMLDELRNRDPAPRSVRRKQRRMEQARQELAVCLNRRPRRREVAARLGVDPGTLSRWEWDVDRSHRVSLSEVVGADGGSGAGSVMDQLTQTEEVQRLRRELPALPERERLIIRLYDLEGWKLREVAERLGVSTSRVSQLRGRALSRLRARMADVRAAA